MSAPFYGYPTVIAYSDEKAVAAVNAYRGWDFDGRITTQVISTPTPTLYFGATTPVLVASNFYEIELTLAVKGSAGGTDILVDFRVDGVSSGPPILSEANLPEGGFLFASSSIHIFFGPETTHLFEFWVSQPGGPGFITCQSAKFSWERKRVL